MKRDWELVREILLRLESLESTQQKLAPGQVPGYDEEVVSYHISLLMQANLIEGTCARSVNAPLFCFAFRLTWHGHEFLDQIRKDTVWNKTVAFIRDRGLELSFETIRTAASVVAKNLLS